MKKITHLIVAMVLISLCLSILSCYWIVTSRESPERYVNYSVQTKSSAYYRIYVLVNRNTAIADEDISLNLYFFSVKPGATIEIHGYSDEPLTVELAQEGPYQLIASQKDYSINIRHVVP
jgi:hypothetical protein